MRQQGSFFNTIELSGSELQSAEAKAKSQEELVKEVFNKFNAAMTPFDVSRLLSIKGYEFPITSIRRAMTVLAEKGILEKCDSYRKGDLGAKNHTWKMK